MVLNPLRLSLILLVGGCSSLALAQPRTNSRSQTSKPKVAPSYAMASSSAPLKKYIGQVKGATDHLNVINDEIVSILKILSDQSSASAQKQTQTTDADTDKDGDTFDLSSPQGKEVLKLITDLQKATLPFRNFNPVPRSAAKVDKEFVAFSLKMEEGLDTLRIYLYAQDNDELGDKAIKKIEEAFNILPIAAADLVALKSTLRSQTARKVYVPG